ncbi:MAG: hypothetical protein WC299_10330, partial [Kiritimatiellia bacterium]
KHPLRAKDLRWRSAGLRLPFNRPIAGKTEKELLQKINSSGEQTGARIWAALGLAFMRRQKAGALTPLACLAAGRSRAIFLPGELFIEYQIAAQKMARGKDVLVASYGNYEPGYVGTKKAYSQGGYETSAASQVGPGAEQIILKAMRAVLR